MSTLPQNSHSEKRGIILPLTAIIIGAILFMVFAIGVDLRIARGARTKLALHLEEACRQAARQLPNTRNAVDVFQGQMRVFFTPKSAGGLGGLPLTKDYVLKITSPTISRTLSPSGETPAVGQITCPFPNVNGVSCKFFGSLDLPIVAKAFPKEPFWNLYGPGNAKRSNIMGDVVSCELGLKTSSLMGAQSSVIARSTWQLRPRGAGLNQPLSSLPPLGQRQQRGGGLLIGIATEMAVRVKEGSTINTRFLLNDPFADPVTPLGATANAFRGNRQSTSWSGTPLLQSAAVAPAANNGTALELEEHRANCANPAVFVRNTMLTAIVERASRGWLRDKTEIVSINPIRFGSATTLITSGEPPTTIVRGGEDLVRPIFQLPALTFKDTRGLPATPTNLNPTQRGTGAQLGDRERFGQLRDCYHVYNNGPGGISRPQDVTIANYAGSVTFEPRPITNQTEALTPAPTYLPGVSLDWEQSLATPRGLTAGQAVAMLGASRYCPTGATLTYPSSAGVGTYTCSQPALRTATSTTFTDLRPDIINFLDYALANSLAHPMPGPSNLTTPGNGTLRTFSQFSHVLLFTHVPITDGEVPEIQNRVRALNNAGRFVTVVYIPTNFLDATDTEISRLKRAFSAADPAVAGSQSSQNVVFHIWPRNGGFSLLTQDRDFRSFWSSLLSTTGPNNAASRAKWLWLPRIMYEELKF